MTRLITLIACIITCLGFAQISFGQDSAVYQWNVTSKKTGEGVYELRFQTPGAKGWQLYAPNQSISDVPATELLFTSTTITAQKPFGESGTVTDIKSALFDNASFKVYEGEAAFIFTINIKGAVPAQLMGTMNYTYGRGEEFYSLTPFQFTVALEGGVASGSKIKVHSIDLKSPAVMVGGTGAEGSHSLWKIFLLGVLGGLLGLLMPCTFPMIPLTVSFFIKQSGKKGVFNAFMYGFFIFLIYILLSLPFLLSPIL